jgi:hypothetical protein
VSLPEQLLLSDLLRLRVRCDQGLDHGPGVIGWMHPPVHRLLGWVSRPSMFRSQRLVWRLDQLRGLSEAEAFVKGEGSRTEPGVLEQLPTLIGATLYGVGDLPLGTVADAAVQLGSGRIVHYLVARSDPRLPGSSRWRLSPERIVDQQPARVVTALQDLDDLPLARSSVRQELLRRSRRWREQVGEETSRLRDQFQQVGDRVEERLEGWLEEPPWDGFLEESDRRRSSESSSMPPEPAGRETWDPLEDWEDDELGPSQPPWDGDPAEDRREPPARGRRAPGFAALDRDGVPAPWSDEFPQGDRGQSGAEQGLEARSRRPAVRRDPERSGSDRYRGRDDDDPWI